MPSYKLCYFDLRGLAEMSRLMFAEAGVAYEDCRVQGPDWPKIKPTMPFGKMPVLYVDDEPIAHSRAIVRYLAREFKLDGGSSLAAAKIDVWIENLFETFMDLPWMEQDKAKKAEKLAECEKNTIAPKLVKLEEMIKSTPGDYAFGENVTALDFMLMALIQYMTDKWGLTFDKYTALTKLTKTTSERPKIAAWLKKRPQNSC